MGQFYMHCSIFYHSDSDFAYVGDSWNHRIVKTKINGSGWQSLGSAGNGTGQFSGSAGLHYDDLTGFIFVVDAFNNRIVKTKMNGSGWTTLGSTGSGKYQFNDLWWDSRLSRHFQPDRDQALVSSFRVSSRQDRLLLLSLLGHVEKHESDELFHLIVFRQEVS